MHDHQSVPSDLYEMQMQRETIAMNAGYRRFFDRRYRETSDITGDTTTGRTILPILLPTVRDHLQALIEGAKSNGRWPDWLRDLEGLDVDLLAAEAVRTGLHLALTMRSLSIVCTEMGRAVEAMHHQNALLAKLGRRKGSQRIDQIMRDNDTVRSRGRAVQKLSGEAAWDETRRIKAAEPLLNALLLAEVDGRPVFVREEIERRDQIITFLALSEEAERLVDEIDSRDAWLSPPMLPMVVPPTPWTTFNSGCYTTKALSSSVPLMRRATPEGRKAMTAAIKDGSAQAVLDAVNAIQAVPLRIDQFIVDLSEWAFTKHLKLKKFPTMVRVKVPELPADFAERSAREKYALFNQRRMALRYNRGIATDSINFRMDMVTAREIGDLACYLPHNLDRRGRVYPVCALNHHRADHVKAWFRFAREEALGTEGWHWLRMHVANVAGWKTASGKKTDKLPFDQRVAWTDENAEMILSIAADPHADLRWTEADKPFSFVAACREYAAALASGNPRGFRSSLITDLDGSNSGVQHYSAALRAPEGAYVNLVPTDAPNDLYGAVADLVLERVRGEAEGLPAVITDPRGAVEALAKEARERKKAEPDHPVHKTLRCVLANIWLNQGITRSTVKRNVMTFAYSSETFGFRDQLLVDLMQPLDIKVMTGELEVHPFGDDAGSACAGYLARRVYDAVVTLLPKVAEGMRFFQACASVLAHERKGVWWKTADGLPVHQCYREYDVKIVQLSLYKRGVPVYERKTHDRVFGDDRLLARFQASVQVKPKNTVNKADQRSAIAPNVIHSADATHLRMSTVAARDVGITDVLLIHDSFGCHAAYLGLFGQVIRETLVRMYNTWCPFTSVFQHAFEDLSAEGREKLPEIPTKGTLDLEQITEATYAFS